MQLPAGGGECLVYTSRRLRMNHTTRNKFKPALIGGIAEGVAGAMPILNLANCACGIMVIGGGFLAAYLYMKDAPPSARAPLGDGFKLGLLTGLFGAVTYCLVAIPVALVIPWWPFGPPQLENVDLPPQAASMLSSPMTMAIFFGLFGFIFDPIFCGIGSVIGVAMFNKKPPVESPLDVLKSRYARGEIDEDEYEARKKKLK